MNGNVYEGKWRNDKKNGLGKYYFFAMDEYYEGEFQNNMKHGFGKYTFSNGDIYEGNFRDNKR